MGTKKPSFTEPLYTPQLVGRTYQRPFRHRLQQNDESSIPMFSESLDMIPELESRGSSVGSAQLLQKQRELAEMSLKRASGINSQPYNSLFKTPAKEDSTINESDILKVSGISNFGFNVQVASTPRDSARDSFGLDVNGMELTDETKRHSKTFEELIYKLKTSGTPNILCCCFLSI